MVVASVGLHPRPNDIDHILHLILSNTRPARDQRASAYTRPKNQTEWASNIMLPRYWPAHAQNMTHRDATAWLAM
jgi:hypothetical protein